MIVDAQELLRTVERLVAAETRIAKLETALRSIFAAADAADNENDWSDKVSAAMTDDVRALVQEI